MLYFVIYTPIYPITVILACSRFLISDLHISSHVIGEKNEVEAKWIKEGCKTSPVIPRRMIQGKNLLTKAKHQNAALEKRRNHWTRDHHRQLVVVDAQLSCLGRMIVRSSCSRVFRSSSRLFDFLAVFCDKSLSFSAIGESIPFYNHSHSHRIARSRLEREFEGEEEDLQSDGGSSKNRKINHNHLTVHFFLLSSLLFSHVQIHICNLL